MSEQEYISAFSDYLFWDIDKAALRLEDNAPYVVQRVLELGQLPDWDLLQSYYGLERIVSICKQLRSLDPKALSFISTITSTPREAFRCYSEKQSAQRHWIY